MGVWVVEFHPYGICKVWTLNPEYGMQIRLYGNGGKGLLNLNAMWQCHRQLQMQAITIVPLAQSLGMERPKPTSNECALAFQQKWCG